MSVKLIELKYTGKTSLGIYGMAKFEVKKCFSKPKIYEREVFIDFGTRNEFFELPSFVDSGNHVFITYPYLSDAIYRELIRQYELHKDIKQIN